MCVWVCMKDGVIGIVEKEGKCSSSHRVWGRLSHCDSVAERRGQSSSSDCSQEKADHKYARLWPAGSWLTALLPHHVATVGGGGIFFSHSTSFPRRTERKRAAEAWELRIQVTRGLPDAVLVQIMRTIANRIWSYS